jgi:hypothetical protein
VVSQTAGLQASAARLTLVGLLAVATGGQNAIARRLVVPDLTTTATCDDDEDDGASREFT